MVTRRGSGRWAGLLALAGVAVIRPLPAQTPEQVLSEQVSRTPVVRLAASGARMTGRLIALGGGEARLETSAGASAVPLAGIDSIWVRGRSTRAGVLVGASVGAVASAVFVGLLAAAVCEYECENAGAHGAVVGFGLGAAGGALVGAAIGAAIPRWRLRFP